MGKKLRIARDLGEAGTLDWLSGWIGGERQTVRVRRIEMTCPATPLLDRRERQKLDKLSAKNQSELHSYLKFAAKKWLETETPGRRVASEQGYYSPGLLSGMVDFRDAKDRRIRLTSPRFLSGRSFFPCEYGEVFRFDLYVKGTVAEVGGTHQSNLLQPLLDGMADRSLWFPYPDTIDYRSFRSSEHLVTSAFGYEVRLVRGRSRGKTAGGRR
ncbi:hypothetical protein SPAN111604_15220 [Sphingomonas antarctica]|uniref:hypothetical protein n=1 Tax=Sphingomonas antarctica TaxID=2040274 RepID=UPI0039EC33B8